MKLPLELEDQNVKEVLYNINDISIIGVSRRNGKFSTVMIQLISCHFLRDLPPTILIF